MDPLGNIPMFMSVLKSVDPDRRLWIILRESLIALLILIVFLFTGEYILKGLGLSHEALSIAGGIILFLIALRMIFPAEETKERQMGEPFIVPLAIPLVAGPSAMAVILLFATQYANEILSIFGALVGASIVVTIILLFCNPLAKMLGQKGLIAVERLMGMILTTIAVQMFLTGLDTYFLS
jgi:multiple antibiotic resistance protein